MKLFMRRSRSVVVNGRLVADGEVQVVVDFVSEREPEAQVIEPLPLDAVDARLAAVYQAASSDPQNSR